MELDADVCYRALTSRDARFDGRIFVGVLSTGIYCRPICPARTPKRKNVRFFSCAAAAAEAGLRPCRRCRPEASPGTPAWLGTSASVSRGLRLIAAGALDDAGVGALAARMGIGERQLRRLFEKHLGASPVAVAQTRRVHFAKQLIDETDLPMTEVALGAGFSSIRRFNTALSAAYGMSPTQLRRSCPSRGAEAARADLELRLSFRPPYDWRGLVAFLGPRSTPGLEVAGPEAVRRAIALGDGAGVIEVRPAAKGDALVLRVPAAAARVALSIAERVRWVFDLGADPLEIAGPLGRDPRLAPVLAAHPGLRVPGAWDGFELAVRAILGQQVSVGRATQLAGRLVATYGKPLARAEGNLTALFPTPSVLAEADLESLGLPRTRAGAIRALARAVHDGRLALDVPLDPQAVVAGLEGLPGIGPWTAQYIAMRALREPDAFPTSDLGLRRAASDSPRPLSERELARRAEHWRPWRAYAAMALWMGAHAGG